MTTAVPRTLTGLSKVVTASGGHPLVRQSRLRDVRGWVRDGALVWTGASDHAKEQALVGLGPGPQTAALVDDIAHVLAGQLVRASLERGAAPLLRRWTAEPFSEWDFLWTSTAPAAQPGEDRVRWLEAVDDPAVHALLDLSNPGSSVRPGGARVRRWAGLRDAAGRLVGCGADTSTPGLGHLSGIAVHPDARREGIGAGPTAYLTRSLLAGEHDTVGLGMYADNDGARRVYRRLGFEDRVRMSGVRLGQRGGQPGPR